MPRPRRARCATQLVDKHPVAILGAADVGSPATIPVYARANLAYLGGVPFTPVEQNAPNSIQFCRSASATTRPRSVCQHTLGVKKASVLYFDDPQGKYAGSVIQTDMKTRLRREVDSGFADAGRHVRGRGLAVAAHPTSSTTTPRPVRQCSRQSSLGYSGHIGGIDPCTDPRRSPRRPADEGIFAPPFFSVDSNQQDANVTLGGNGKYAPEHIAIDSRALRAIAP